jgi:hypothetical protein
LNKKIIYHLNKKTLHGSLSKKNLEIEEYLVTGPSNTEDKINCATHISTFEVVKAFIIIQRVLKSMEGAIVKSALFLDV